MAKKRHWLIKTRVIIRALGKEKLTGKMLEKSLKQGFLGIFNQ